MMPKFCSAGEISAAAVSREHAAWALTQFGFRAGDQHLDSPDIFKGNSLKIAAADRGADGFHASFFALPEDAKIQVDWHRKTITLPDGTKVEFPSTPSRRPVCTGI